MTIKIFGMVNIFAVFVKKLPQSETKKE